MADPLSVLSPRQLQCLRLVGQGLEAKEIGRALGISDMTVKNHLSAARTALGVARSIDAARLVAKAEMEAAAGATGTRGTSTPPGIADRSYLNDPPPGRSEDEREVDGVGDSGGLTSLPLHPSLPLPFPTRRGQRNELGIGARLAIVVALTVLLIAAVGFFVEASRGLRF
ncbi:helix-turn-helix transcriptional regulator [Sphingomonas sp. KR1UV-12]|uniref:Helix-turn-helix transcriptional regulator n=1 Tax=Sphingomonas aurea TaxID=3063994 RepID=A0ABT9EG72_9SPHN|nr:helix-turn-helix transcriptional regulator [Sphingomonas sp. KR1UV-12]MDP1025964.1 helix-turn-helix transcriptional regulator [Sphingomonas sp. KR1UV-12]